MSRPRIAAHVAYATLGAVAFLLVACGDIGVGLGGGARNNPYTCSIGQLNDAWHSARITGDRVQPARCPYQVEVPNQFTAFAANVFAPQETVNATGWAELQNIHSTFDNVVLVPYTYAYWELDPNVSTGLIATLTGNYQAAHYPAGQGPWSHDSGVVDVPITNYGQASAFITLSGSAEANPVIVAQPARIVAQAPATFRAITDVDTNAYDFAWSVDSVAVDSSNNAQLTTTLSMPGPHRITVYATNATDVMPVDTIVTAELNVTVSGPANISLNTAASYGVVFGAGAVAPFTYQWSKNGVVVGTGATYSYFARTCGTVILTVSVSDAAGHTGRGGMSVTTNPSSQCTFK
jgi:hypothetical protein